jgi:hypothetical protein
LKGRKTSKLQVLETMEKMSLEHRRDAEGKEVKVFANLIPKAERKK